MNVTWPSGAGAILALIVLVLDIVFFMVGIGGLTPVLALFIGGLALARLL